MHPDTLERIKRVVAAYPNAPHDIHGFLWLSVPRYWQELRVPVEEGRAVVIQPQQEDQHAGIRFRVGWNTRERVVALWLL